MFDKANKRKLISIKHKQQVRASELVCLSVCLRPAECNRRSSPLFGLLLLVAGRHRVAPIVVAVMSVHLSTTIDQLGAVVDLRAAAAH
jgi:hypothetical protein